MPPIPVTLHSSPSHTSPTKRITALPAPVILGSHGHQSHQHRHAQRKSRMMLYYSTAADSPPLPTHASSDSMPTATGENARTGDPSPTPSSSGSSNSQTRSHRTKPLPRPPAELQGATLVPQLRSIVDRCYLPASGAVVSSGSGKSGSATPSSTHRILPYNPMVDLGNDRSSIPSPKEVLRMQRWEEQKIEAKKASAAAARAAIAQKRKSSRKSRGGSKSRGGAGTATRSASPVPSAIAAPANGKEGAVPAITTQPASPSLPDAPTIPAPAIIAPIPSRVSLKRTRSTGPLNISASTANALGGAPHGAGSPLKAVHGPEDGEGDGENADIDKEDQKVVKRLKSTASLLSGGSTSRGTRRKTDSPPSTSGGLLPDAPGVVKAEAGEVGGVARRSLSIGEGGTGGGSTAMRRVASAHVPSIRSRLGSTGPLDAAARERSKRETNLPRALRDYDTRAGVY